MSVETSTAAVVVARYGELWLKGKNRGVFERRLAQNVKNAVKDIGGVRVERAGIRLSSG